MSDDRARDVDQLSHKPVLAGTRLQNIHNKQLFIHSLHLPEQAARMQPLNQTASSCRMTSQILFGPSQQDRIVPSANSEDTPPAHHRHRHNHNSRSYSRQVNEYIVANSMHCRAQHLHNSYQKKIGQRRLRKVGSEDKGRGSESTRQPITSAASHAYKNGPIFISNYMQLLVITLGLLSLLSQLKSVIGQQQQQQLPTVIVRGFLNYRTTVDGTVLLFTPDAGQQQQQPAASTIQSSPPAYLETSATNEPAIAATATYFTAPPKSINMASSSADRIEPTSVPVAPISSHIATGAGGDDNYDRKSPIAEAVSDTAQADQWRPIQATPPLRSASSRRGSASSVEDGASNNSGEPSSKPAVQADDIVTAGGGSTGNVATSTTATSAKESDSGRNASPASKPKRPTFSQGSRAGAALQSRFRQTSDGSSSNSINGIRRPGLANGLGGQQSPASSTTSAPNVQSSSEPSAQAASAFQSRLASANARMRNRLKHKQHLFGNSGAGSGHNNTSNNNNNNSPQASALASLAPSDGTLDVASSIEQPTSSSAASAVGTSDQGATGTGGEHIAAWSPLQAAATSPGASFRPAVGSDEILVSAANGGDQPGSGPDSETAAGANGSSKTEPDLGLEPLSPEQEAGLRPLSRSGELRPSSGRKAHGGGDEQPKLLRGQLQHGALSSGPLNLDALFQSDQPSVSSSNANSGQQQQATDTGDHSDSKPGASGLVRPNGSALGKPRPMSHNDKLNGWLGTHHNKFVPRPAPKQHGEAAGSSLSRQLAANLNQLSPSFSVPHISPTSISMSGSGGSSSSSISLSATPSLQATATTIATNGGESTLAANGSSDYATAALDPAGSTPIPVAHPDSQADGIDSPSSPSVANVSMQTITRTYSTVMTTSKTRLVPLQVKSSTSIYTITEDYVMTKMMTAYQTMPAGEFILPEAPSVSAFDVFADDKRAPSDTSAKSEQHQAAAAGGGASSAPFESQEQPISLDTSSSPSSSSSSKSAANNWLHDFTNPGQDTGASQLSLGEPAADPFQQTSQQQQAAMLALLEQQARDANLAGTFPGPGETLDQLASQLDPAALLADGAINIPDLNNPLVLAAAIQNPQLAAVILAAQQLKLKQRQNKFIQQQQQQQSNLNNQQQLQPQVTYSTSYSTTTRPSTYTARDTMYTTRLVSFRDGRTVRTRTVSEPGSVIEQVLTTTVTERVPITITIKPTGVIMPLAAPTAAPSLASAASATSNNQATINNALFASQLASILARRQHQLQTSFSNPALMGLGGTNSGLTATSGLQANQAATPQQLQAMQQLFNQQKRQQSQQLQHQQNQQQQQAQATAPVAANQFQPNLQQLLQNMQQQQQKQLQPSASQNASPTSQSTVQQGSNQNDGNQNGDSSSRQQQDNGSSKSGPVGNGQFQATPSLPVIPKSIDGSPITTTLTSLQVRTYTVHNAFKTIFRTITSTVLIPTVLASG